MTPGDAARVLGAAAMFDARKVDRPDAQVWHQVIGDLDFEDAMEAVRRHYATSTERIMPAHIRQIVREIRAERKRREPHPMRELPSRFEPDVTREVRMARGAATCREVLAAVAGHLVAREESPPPASAIRQLRELTAGPGWVADGDAGAGAEL